jgi:hypothetical protein
MAGFAVSINGWIWVSTEVTKDGGRNELVIVVGVHERDC